MALDTDGKRFSAINIGCPWRGINYVPTGTIDAGERLAFDYLGSSISSAPPPTIYPGGGAVHFLVYHWAWSRYSKPR